MILPVPVTLNRLADPLCVFIFGMVRRPLLLAPKGQRHRPAARVRGGATPLEPHRRYFPAVPGYTSLDAGADASLRGLGTWRGCAAACVLRSALASVFFRCGPITMIMFRP